MKILASAPAALIALQTKIGTTQDAAAQPTDGQPTHAAVRDAKPFSLSERREGDITFTPTSLRYTNGSEILIGQARRVFNPGGTAYGLEAASTRTEDDEGASPHPHDPATERGDALPL